MPKMPWRLAALVQELTDDLVLAEALLFPGASCLGRDRARLSRTLAKRLSRFIRKLPSGQAWRHRLGEAPQVKSLEVEVAPIRGDGCRRTAVTLNLQYVTWKHAREAQIAYFPALEIEVLAADERELESLLLPQVLSALARGKTASHLKKLVLLDRRRQLAVRPLRLVLNTPTLKEAAVRERRQEGREKSLFKEIAVELASQRLAPIHEREEEVARLDETLTGPLPRSVLLVGRSGVGKTALVRELVRRDLAGKPERRLNLWSTSGGRIIAGMCGFGDWQERCEKLVKEAAKRKAIVHLDHLLELIEVGKGAGNDRGVASHLRPYIAAGKLLAIAECSPEELAAIEREDPKLFEAFVRIDVEPTSPERTRAILSREAEGRFAPAALATLDRLHRRFATYSAAPGRPLRFLRNLIDERRSKEKEAIDEREVCAAFADETGLPRFILDDAAPLDLAETREWFSSRVIGQQEAVDLIVDMLAGVKTELARTGKPIASLLFIGPSGVGKTEMAKSLAEFLYRDRHRLIRFDMSEYAHPAAVERLIGGAGCSQGLLTQKVRDQPFMVVLLDEFEKAHPSFHDVLLQVFGEGRLTDGAGRVADFTSSVVIATSNLGAESFRPAGIGFTNAANRTTEGGGARQHFEREVKAFLRPEMFNRIDRIVPFAPLGDTTIAAVAAREIARALERDGVRLRGVRTHVDEAAKAHVAGRGVDARYGARPLKAAIERELMAPLAAQLNEWGDRLAIDCRVGLAEDRLIVEAKATPTTAGESQNSHIGDSPASQTIRRLQHCRWQHQSLVRSGALMRIRNDLERLDQARRQQERRAKRNGKKELFTYTPTEKRADRQRQMLTRVDALGREIEELEDSSLLDLYSSRPIDADYLEAAIAEIGSRLQSALFDVHRQAGEQASVLSVAIYSASIEAACQLADAYRRVCEHEKAAVDWRWLKMYRPELNTRPPPHDVAAPVFRLQNRKQREDDSQQKVVDVFAMKEAELTSPPADAIGLAMIVREPLAMALLETESGEHLFQNGENERFSCFVETASVVLKEHEPPADVGRSSAFRDLRRRRGYDLEKWTFDDVLLRQRRDAVRGDFGPAIEEALRDYLAQRIRESLETWS